ncbi:MAG TPA: pilus assembly protein N-terminal domain-containing protein, partial [Candidatus Baltobacteraceae bacterium]|nr:pilus assembly protein N-terminal domain-containing protein [Candidatus Baltobacteraceae bacterium]
MNPKSVLISAVVALALIGSVAPMPVTAGQTHVLEIASGSSVVLNTPGLLRASVGDGKIASVIPVGDQQAVVSGRTPGRTTVILWTRSSEEIYAVTVSEQSLDV